MKPIAIQADTVCTKGEIYCESVEGKPMKKKTYIVIIILVFMTLLILLGGVYVMIRFDVFNKKSSAASGRYTGDGEENIVIHHDGTIEFIVDGEVIGTDKVPMD